MAPPSFTITSVRTPAHISAARALFSAYALWLDIDLTFQKFDLELAGLPGVYAPPGGELLLAYLNASLDPPNDLQRKSSTEHDDAPLGCIALRPLPHHPGICEVKRLYVAPSGRGLGIGRAFVERILKVAEELGYVEIRLDTLQSMVAARKLYERLGFEQIEAYYETPVIGTIFLGRKLGGNK